MATDAEFWVSGATTRFAGTRPLRGRGGPAQRGGRPPGALEIWIAYILGRNGLTETLGHVWLAAGPVQDPLQQHALVPLSGRLARHQAFRQRSGLLGREVGELDAPANVERRHPRVRNQI